MSLNIQTSNGLLEIGGKVTKEKVIEALGYSPANESHVEDGVVHITSEERETWNNKSDVVAYSDLLEAPNITDDGSNNLTVADNNGNVIMKVDADGITTTNVNAKTIELDGEDLGVRLDEIEAVSLPNIADDESGDLTISDSNGNIIAKIDANGLETTNVIAQSILLNGKNVGVEIDEHTSNATVHITSDERAAWNNKSDFSGFYADLPDAPNITEDESGEVVYADDDGSIIAKIDANGLETTTVTAQSVIIDGIDITVKLDEHKEEIDGVSGNLTTHTSNSTVHITADERTLWNNKSDFSGNYNDLTNAPDIKEDESGEVVYVDKDNNVIAKIGENGFETTQVIANNVIANGVDVGSSLSSHTGNTDIHVTATDKKNWDDKATKTYVDQKVADLVNSAPAALDTLDELAAALGDDANFATTVTNQIASKANQTDLDSHTVNNSNPHNVTKAQVGLGNVDNTSDINKPVSTAQQAALDGLKAELSETIVSESDEWIIADNSGNIITKVDANGLETTTVTADAVVVNGTDVEAELSKKANVSHTHDQYLGAADIAGKADKSELHNHDNKTELDKIVEGKAAYWDAKSEFSGAYADLDGVPNITEDESGDLVVADKNGNIIFRSSETGLETTTLTAQAVVVNGTDIKTALAEKSSVIIREW